MYQPERLHYLAQLVERHARTEGLNRTCIESLGLFKATQTAPRSLAVDIPGIVVVCQGGKLSFVGDKVYEYAPGQMLVGFYPVPIETEIIKASADEPYLLAGLAIDSRRIANVLLRLDQVVDTPPKLPSADPSNNFAAPLNDKILNPFIRLVELLDNPTDAAMLSDSIIDEIYYRLVSQERGGELRHLLQQRGDIQRISRVVSYIHDNLDKNIAVDDLASMAHMSRTLFYNHFKAVMHMSPFQYAKGVKLHEAQRLLNEGKRANEAGHLVGYMNPAQFSREYKRYFGYPPSTTKLANKV